MFPWGGKSGFFQAHQKIFFPGGKSVKILFYPFETKQTTFFGKSLIGKCQISQSLSDSHDYVHIVLASRLPGATVGYGCQMGISPAWPVFHC